MEKVMNVRPMLRTSLINKGEGDDEGTNGSRHPRPDRLINYRNVGALASVLNHFYDKLLHNGQPEDFENTGTPYFDAEAAVRYHVIVDFVCHFGPVTPNRME